MKLASTTPNNEKTEQKLSVNIPKSPSFHSGLDLVASAGHKYVNISKFNFSNDMNGNNSNKTTASDQQSNQQTIFSFTKVCKPSAMSSCFFGISRSHLIAVFYAIKSIE